MTALGYPFAWLPVVVVFGVPATIIVPLLAYVWLAVLFVVACVAVVALGRRLVAASVAARRRLSWGRPPTATPQASRSVPPRAEVTV
jgi:hypothetical protein